MVMNNRYVNALVFVIACSYFSHTLYWITRSVRFNFSVLTSLDDFGNILGSVFGGGSLLLAVGIFLLMGFGGLAIRFIGAVNAVFASYLIWRRGTTSLPSVKGKVATALFCEGFYWGLFLLPIIPISIYASDIGLASVTVQFLVLSFSIQILLISPLLISLSFKFRSKAFDPNALYSSRLVWLAYISYVAALWANYTLRWLEVIAYRGLNALLIESTYIGFLNSAVTLFFAVFFAIAGAFPVLRRRGSPVLKWFGLSLTFLGLHFLIHILYTAYTGVLVNALEYRLKFMLLSDVWPVAALGLGLYLLTKISPKNGTYPKTILHGTR